MNIICLSSNPALIRTVANKYGSQVCNFLDYQGRDAIHKADCFLIISPILVSGEWVVYDHLWFKYLRKHSPETRFAVLSFDKKLNSLSQDILALPDHFEGLFLQLPDSFEYGEGGLTHPNVKIEQKIQRFFAGHGKKSVMEVLYVLMRKLNLVQREINLGEWSFEKIFDEYLGSDYTDDKWKEFRLRWESYLSYFSYSPFKQDFKEIEQLITHISPFFDEKSEKKALFLNLECSKNLGLICKILVKIREESGVLLENRALLIQ